MNKFLNKIFSCFKSNKSDFDRTFNVLLRYENSGVKGSKKVYELLKELNISTENSKTSELIFNLNKINFASNTNDWFYFYFPIVTHILYYKPNRHSDILNYLIGPNFANGIDNVDKMIAVIQGAMEYKLKEDPNFISMEGRLWIINTFPKLKHQIKIEIDKCIEELNT